RKAQERMHIVSALLKAIDRIDEVIALIRASASASEAQQSLMALLEIDEIQARAILDMQLRKLAALERQELINEHDELAAKIADYEDILASPQRQRDIVGTELAEIVHKFGDDRRTEIVAYDGEVADEDLIAEEDVAVTITYGGSPSAPRPTYTGPSGAAARESAARSCAPTTSWTTSSSPRRTTGSCSLPTRAGSTGPRPTSCRTPAVTPVASTWPTCSLSSRTSGSPRCSRCAITRWRRTWCWLPAAAW